MCCEIRTRIFLSFVCLQIRDGHSKIYGAVPRESDSAVLCVPGVLCRSLVSGRVLVL